MSSQSYLSPDGVACKPGMDDLVVGVSLGLVGHFVKRITKQRQGHEIAEPAQEQRRRPRVVVALEVEDLERSIRFWRDVANLDVKRTEHFVNVAGYIALFPAAHPEPPGARNST